LGSAALLATLFAGTRSFASGLFTTVLFLYFLLVSGDTFLRRLVEILPRFRSKRRAVDISQQIESDVSAYLLTITIMNAALVFWFWMWGIPGAIPIRANARDRQDRLRPGPTVGRAWAFS
jgi:predicted PurR-regulated permease PerM